MIARFASGEAIVRYEPAPPMAGTTGDIEALSMWAGQDVALARQTSQRRTSWPSSPPACNPGTEATRPDPARRMSLFVGS